MFSYFIDAIAVVATATQYAFVIPFHLGMKTHWEQEKRSIFMSKLWCVAHRTLKTISKRKEENYCINSTPAAAANGLAEQWVVFKCVSDAIVKSNGFLFILVRFGLINFDKFLMTSGYSLMFMLMWRCFTVIAHHSYTCPKSIWQFIYRRQTGQTTLYYALSRTTLRLSFYFSFTFSFHRSTANDEWNVLTLLLLLWTKRIAA